MLTIRLARAGAKKKPFFHITVADSRMPRDGRFIERVGYFNPISRGKEVRLEVNQERIDYWVSQGAQLSERVLTLIEEIKETPEEKIKREEKKEKRRLKKVAKSAEKKLKDTPTEEVKEEEAPAEEVKEEEAPAEEAASEDTPTEEVKEEGLGEETEKASKEKPEN